RSWNTRMYPAWKEGDPRFRNCWKGGNVTFELKNDAPTLSGAKATFNINLNFPSNQTVLSNGTVVWAQNCTVDGQQYQAGQPVYPDTQGTTMFPDGTPIRAQRRPQKYVYVWKTWGRFWQVADGPSSSLSIGTENIPMGSYDMELVIYHQRGKSNFIPLGYASSRFTITDQVPFTISMSQVNDLNVEDQSFIQNRAVAFSVNLHDPSQYLSAADLSFTWDFGDNTGTLISRDRTVTHTYQTVGSFKPQVILMASIPTCGNPTAAAVEDATAAVATEETVDEAAPIAEEAPVTEATPVLEDAPVEAEAAEVETVTEGAVVEETEAAADNTVAAAATVAPETAPEAPLEGEVVAEVAETENVAELPLVIAKRQAPELTADCTVYRYGSLATSVQVVQGIESVEIVQVSNVMSLATALDQNAVDVTVSCQGSLPSEVCTVVSDADCVTPVQTLCSVAVPTPDCQLVLRQFFNDTGIFCLNVSLTNDVSLAVTSARVNVNMGMDHEYTGLRLKQYQPLVEESGSGSVRTSVPMLLWNLLTRQSPGESRPLLHGRIV
uniref:PKD domain-containing protein n=1 Tax=Periophthalmus magnuspinnatus TaxID=409849 RepID=A0A3B4B7I4_9GOBI